MTGNRNSRTQAFTLVELLVVVGIITILIAILLPALSRARDHANRVKCAANLHSIGLAMIAYTERYGCYPSCELFNGKGNYAIWPVRLRVFTSGNQDVFSCPSEDTRCIWREPMGGRIETATAVHAAYGYELDEQLLLIEGAAPPGSGTYFSYGYNLWGTSVGVAITSENRGLGHGVVTSEAGRAQVPEMRASRVRVPSDMVAIADSDVNGDWDFMISPNHPGLPPGKVHGGGANVLFCDGHVQWYLQKDIIYQESAFDLRSKAIQCMWNNDHLPEVVR
jgi:prepilin-type processing-associated H-X9-DG protein/prepilin-type N-terminal cleavage/methylation domain-containing protein